jgi:hypothetical protein
MDATTQVPVRHSPMVENPAKTLDLIRDFLRQVPGQGRPTGKHRDDFRLYRRRGWR